MDEKDVPHFDYDPVTGVGFGVGWSRAPMDHGKARAPIDLDTLALVGDHPCCFKWDGTKAVRYREEHPLTTGIAHPRQSIQAQIDAAKSRLGDLEQKIGETHLLVQAIARKVGINETDSN